MVLLAILEGRIGQHYEHAARIAVAVSVGLLSNECSAL
jgi:hypothetical protein